MAMGGSSPTGPRPPVSSTDDFELVEDTPPLKKGQLSLKDRITATFGSRTVAAVPPASEKLLKPYLKLLPTNQEQLRFKALRMAGRTVSKKSDVQNVIMKPVERIHPAVASPLMAPEKLDDFEVGAYCSDADLLKNIDGADATYVSGKEGLPEIIFHNGIPLPEDVRQSDKRSTCFLMSALASYAASPVGKEILTSNIMPVAEGCAVVRFYDFITEKPVNVLVSTARLVDKKGHDYYSFGNQTGANWAGVVEKAFHAYRINRVAGLKDLQEEAFYKGDMNEAGELDSHIDAITGKDKSSNLLDNANLYTSLRFLPSLPALDKPEIGDYVQVKAPWVLHDGDLVGKNLKLLKFNVDHGVPVVLGTRSIRKGLFGALKTGTPTDHAVAVLAPGEIKKGGKSISGVLIYDPYGESLDKGQKVQLFSKTKTSTTAAAPLLQSSGASAEDVEEYDFGDDLEAVLKETKPLLMTKAGGRSVRFYAYEDLEKHFSTAAIASGGFDFKAGSKPKVSKSPR